MASNHTANFSLSQWEETDQVLRADFNADNAKIDAALSAAEQQLQTVQTQTAQVDGKVTEEAARAQAAEAALTAYSGNCIVMAGTYVGTGGAGSLHQCKLTFPYKPMLVFLERDFTLHRGGSFASKATGSGYQTLSVYWSEDTVRWFSDSGNAAEQCNVSGQTYPYLAFLLRADSGIQAEFAAT